MTSRLSKHFTMLELIRSSTAARLGIPNTPGYDEIANLKYLAVEILDPVRVNFGVPFSPQSGFRCLRLNQKLGSKDTSQHLTGQAVDFEIPGIANAVTAQWIKENLIFDQLILEFHNPDIPASGWVHVSTIKGVGFEKSTNRNLCLIYDGRHFKEF